MTTGLNVRDFFKEYRDLRYSNSGSIGFTEIEKNAYRLSLTLEITHLDAPRYSNLKTLPENTHYGYVTLFRGSTVTDSIAIKYPKFRIFDIRNQGIWNYHQATESLRISSGEIEGGFNATGAALESGLQLDDLLCIAFWLFTPVSGLEGALLSLRTCIDGPPPDVSSVRVADSYTAFPVASPFPDIAKFKADVPCSFLWRLEAWYLYEPGFYESNSPTDSGDETDGEDEYPEPESGDGDGDGDEFPDESARDQDRDIRDYSGGLVPPGARVRISYTVNAWQFGCVPVSPQGQIEVNYEGSLDYSLEFISSTPIGCPDGNSLVPVGLRLVTPLGNRVVLESSAQMRGQSSIDSVELIVP